MSPIGPSRLITMARPRRSKEAIDMPTDDGLERFGGPRLGTHDLLFTQAVDQSQHTGRLELRVKVRRQGPLFLQIRDYFSEERCMAVVSLVLQLHQSLIPNSTAVKHRQQP